MPRGAGRCSVTDTATDTSQAQPGSWLVRDAKLGERPVDVRVHGGQIVEVGTSLVGAGETVVEAGGRRVLPGLRDAHVHFTTWALDGQTVELNQAIAAATSARDAALAIAKARTDRSAWIRASGFRQATWPSDPHKSLLDAAAPDQPVVLTSQDVHSSWWSSAALAAIGLDHPDGYLRERESWDALGRIPASAADEVDKAVRAAMSAAAARGITSIVDYEFGGAAAAWARRSDDLDEALQLRVTAAVMRDELDAALDAQWATGTRVDRAGMVHVGGLKLFTDGALGSRTAWCDHHYAGEPDNHGRALLGAEELAATLTRAAAAGLRPNVHAIGDAANHMVLDAFATTGVHGTVEHAQLLDPSDLTRFASVTTAASVQPSHAVDDRDLAERWWADRLDRAYPLRSLLDAGVSLHFGSDAPVAPLDPWRTIAAAVARTLDDLPPWLPSQAVSLDQALACSTASSIAPGEVADLILLEDDPATVAPVDLAHVRVRATMCAGHWTHGPFADRQE